MSKEFPTADQLRETGEAARALADLVFRYIPLDSGENPGTLPRFANRDFGYRQPGGPRGPIYHLERLIFRQPGWLFEPGEYGKTTLSKCDPDLFYNPTRTTWGDKVDQAVEALRKHLGALKWYFNLPLAAYVGTDRVLNDRAPYVPSVPAIVAQEDGTFAPKPALPEICPDRDKPPPAAIIEGMRVAAGVLIDAVNTGEKEAAGKVPGTEKTPGWWSCADLAKKHKVKPDMIRKRLERWRKQNGEGWMEVRDSERTHRGATFLYRSADVQPVIDDMPGR